MVHRPSQAREGDIWEDTDDQVTSRFEKHTVDIRLERQ